MLLLAATTASTLLAANDEAVTTAVADPSTIVDAITGENKVGAPAFAADVISAIAQMPKSPAIKLSKFVDSSKVFFANVEIGEIAPLVVSSISGMPYEFLPGWVNAVKPTSDKRVLELDDGAYNTLLSSVVGGIAALKDFSEDDKAIQTAFALKLLAKLKDFDPEDPIIAAVIKTIPGTYQAQLTDTLPKVFAGDYTPVLGDIKPVMPPAPSADKPVIPEPVPTTPSTEVEMNLDEGIETISNPTPIAPAPIVPTPPKPPVPKPYAGQF